MQFPSKIDYYGGATLKHSSNQLDSFTYFIDRGLSKTKTDPKIIKRTIAEYKLTFCNHFIETSHFVRFISNNRLASGFREVFFGYLLLYIKQFYPDFLLTERINDVPSLIELFNRCYKRYDESLGLFLEKYSLESVKHNIQEMTIISKFYEIIEDFMIRFYEYSIIGISNQKHIITASSQCDKKFFDYLIQGYSLFRLQKVGLVNTHSSLEEHFEFIPALPTKELDFPIDEYIEISDGSNSMEGLKLVKLLH